MNILPATSGGIDVTYEAPAATAPHRRTNERHEREILLSIRVVADDSLIAYLRSIPFAGPGWYGDWRCGPHERICIQHPRCIRIGTDVRIRVTRECYRSNFWETRLSFEPLHKAVPDDSKWHRIPLVESWADARTQVESIVGVLPTISHIEHKHICPTCGTDSIYTCNCDAPDRPLEQCERS